MLEIVKYNCDEYEFPCLLVLGCFNSVHSGHAELLKKAKLQAKINGLDLGVMTFTDGKDGERQVNTFEERLALFEQFNVKFVLQIDYDEEFKKTEALDFLHIVEDKLNVKAYMSGKDFRFGTGAKGKSSTLKKYAEDEDNGVWYVPLKEVTYGEEKISTSVIKELLSAGEVKKAAEMLGRNYSVCGVVEPGAERGASKLGFPTINIRYPENKAEVKCGVYSAVCSVDGEDYKAVVNYGGRPTFDEPKPILEAHIIDFNGDVYGHTVVVQFVDYIRDILKFDSAEELSEQIKRDICAVQSENTPAETTVETPAETPAAPAEVIAEAPAATAEETPAEEAPAEAPIEEAHDEATVEEAPAELPAGEAPAEAPIEEAHDEATVEEAPAELPAEEALAETPEEAIPEEAAEEGNND